MSRLELNDIGSLIDASTAKTTINNNNTAIEEAFENTLSRDGTSPNEMNATLDMNSNHIINLPAPVSFSSPLRLQDLSDFLVGGSIGTLPTGGLAGQVLSKASTADFDTAWANSVTSVGLSLPADFTITGSPVTTTGTLTGAWAVAPTGTGAMVRQIGASIGGASVTSVTSFSFAKDGFHWFLAPGGGTQTANRTLTISVNDANRALNLNGGTAYTFGGDFTTSSTFSTAGALALPAVVQGDVWYGSASGTITALAKNTSATRYLSNRGTSNNPSWNQIDLSTGVENTLGVGNGGTSFSSYTNGDIIVATGTNTLGKLGGIASGNALITGGVGSQPSYGKIGLTTHVSGVLPVANGGTNASSQVVAKSVTGLNIEAFTGWGNTNITIASSDRIVGTNAAFSAARTATLPAANAVNAGGMIVVADFQGTVTGSNTATIQRAGSDTINGGTSVVINSANGAYILWSDGSTKWTAQAIGSSAVAGVSSLGGLTGVVGVANGIETSGSNIQITAARRTLPTVQAFTSGTGATYTTPANCLWLEVWCTAGGGGGGGGGTAGQTGGGAGGNSIFNTINATGGTGGQAAPTVVNSSPGKGGAGGTAGSGTATRRFSGAGGHNAGLGQSGIANGEGGNGGTSGMGVGGGGVGGCGNADPGGAGMSFGGGGGGTDGGTGGRSGAGGGGGGETFYLLINSPAASYTYTVGAGGTAGSAGTSGAAGGAGAAGYIFVLEHYGT